MKNRTILFQAVLFFFCLFFLMDGFSEAARMGGGRSFGSRPSYQRSAPQPAAAQRNSGKTTPAQQPGAPAQGSWWSSGGFKGMLGGMLMGGLLGSLLSGGMGHFTGPGLLDIILIGGGLFLLYRFIRSRRAAMAGAGQSAFSSYAPEQGETMADRAGTGWGGGLPPSGQGPIDNTQIPPGFDQAEFMKGAKAMYNRLQESWDKRDLEDIRHFTSPEVLDEISRQAEEDPTPGKTEILLVNARLLEVKSHGHETVASVYYDVMMRESKEEDRPKQVREVWHFRQDDSVPDSFWILEGIQQLED